MDLIEGPSWEVAAAGGAGMNVTVNRGGGGRRGWRDPSEGSAGDNTVKAW